MDEGGQSDIVAGGGDYIRGFGVERQLVANVGVGGISRYGVVGLNVEPVNVPTVGIGGIENHRGSVVVKYVGSVAAVRNSLCEDSTVGNNEILGQGAGQVVVLLVGDRPSESNLHLHQVGPVVERSEVDALTVGHVSHLVDAEVFEDVVDVGLQVVQLATDHLHSSPLNHPVNPTVVIVALTEICPQTVARRYYPSLEVDLLVVENRRIDTNAPVYATGLTTLQLESSSVGR